MRQKDVDAFLLDLADEEQDAEQFSGLDRPDEAQWPAWSGTVREAWYVLRDDRYYGSMGGLGGIYYTALSQYARDRDIPLSPFDQFVMAMDAEFVAFSNEKAQAEPETEDE